MKMKTKNKQKFIDDGHTIYNMDVDGMPKRKTTKPKLYVTTDEKKAMIKAAFAHFLPILIMVVACFAVAMLIILVWLH